MEGKPQAVALGVRVTPQARRPARAQGAEAGRTRNSRWPCPSPTGDTACGTREFHRSPRGRSVLEIQKPNPPCVLLLPCSTQNRPPPSRCERRGLARGTLTAFLRVCGGGRGSDCSPPSPGLSPGPCPGQELSLKSQECPGTRSAGCGAFSCGVPCPGLAGCPAAPGPGVQGGPGPPYHLPSAPGPWGSRPGGVTWSERWSIEQP